MRVHLFGLAALVPGWVAAFTPPSKPAAATTSNLYAPQPGDRSPRILTAREAEAVLSAYDREHMTATLAGRSDDGTAGDRSLGAWTANAWALQAAKSLPLREAVMTLLADTHKYASIRLGVTSPKDAGLAVDALSSWVDALGLPRGLLYGTDRDGEPLDLTGRGAYVKYSSRRSRVDAESEPAAPGSARLHPYEGDFSGVTLAVGAGPKFRQYAALPLGLFCADVDARAAPLTPLPPPGPPP